MRVCQRCVCFGNLRGTICTAALDCMNKTSDTSLLGAVPSALFGSNVVLEAASQTALNSVFALHVLGKSQPLQRSIPWASLLLGLIPGKVLLDSITFWVLPMPRSCLPCPIHACDPHPVICSTRSRISCSWVIYRQICLPASLVRSQPHTTDGTSQ